MSQHSNTVAELTYSCVLFCVSLTQGLRVRVWNADVILYFFFFASVFYLAKLLKCAHVFRPMAIYFYLLTSEL